MHSKSIALIALSATAATASPFHKRHEFHHHRFHGTGQPTGTGAAFPAGNDTNGLFGPTGTGRSGLPFSQVVTQTVSPLPVFSDDAVEASTSSSSCTATSVVTETSINLITVTGSAVDTAETEVALTSVSSVSAGAFYGGGGHSWSWGGNNGWSSSTAASAPAVSIPAVPSAPAFSSGVATTFVSMPSGAKGSAVASSAVASAVVSSVPSTGSSGGKRGISFNDASLVAAFGNSVSWSYNWASTESGNLDGVEYVPMMWGTNSVSNFASQVGSATHVLSFNEPDLSSQSNIDPVTAAKLHVQGMQSLVGKVQIGSPAVTNGAGTSPAMGVDWLSQFFKACGSDCPVDFVAYHWYAGSGDIAYFKQHTQDIINVANQNGVSKVWLTEFQPTDGDASAQAAFMQEAVAFLESTAAVERYAAFMASDGTMLTGNSLNTVGKAYADAS